MLPDSSLISDSTVLMSATEARDCVAAINDAYAQAGNALVVLRQQILTLLEGEGWRALGYDSWRACVVAEFQQRQSRFYELLTEARIERQLELTFPTVGKPQTARQFKALAKVAERNG